MLSLKLAMRNIKKGMRSFGPFLLASLTIYVMLFVSTAIAVSPSLKQLPFGGAALGQMMSLAIVVLTVFGAMILVYSYRFLQLQRSREFGLYDILGFGKGRIALVSFFELLMSYVITLLLGSVIGIAFSKFSFLVFVNLIGGKAFNLKIDPIAILIVSFIFLIFFVLLLLIGTFIIWRSSSLDLLKEASKGEKEPKSNIFLALLAVILLGAGYYIAISVANPITALTKFFFAVILVIFGTYFFYVSFTVWYLKRKKKRPSYYQPNNFITTSSMLYRMKANAVGLGNITILLSMAIVTMVVTVGIFFGTEGTIRAQYPKEGQVTSFTLNREKLTTAIQETARQSNIPIENLQVIKPQYNLINNVKLDQKTLTVSQKLPNQEMMSFVLVTQADLEKLGNKLPKLGTDQMAFYRLSGKKAPLQSVNWFGEKFDITHEMTSLKHFPEQSHYMDSILLIVSNDSTLNRMMTSFNKTLENGNTQLIETVAMFDIDAHQSENFGKVLAKVSPQKQNMYSRTQTIKEAQSFIGGFVFIGFLLGVSFILGAALIIYYKQLSEGAQDQRSFKILQEVGLSKIEVQKTITSQVRLIFFLPIVVTLIHFGFAYIMVSKIIGAFGINDTTMIALVSLATIVVVALIYYAIYKLTSRVYYKIVER